MQYCVDLFVEYFQLLGLNICANAIHIFVGVDVLFVHDVQCIANLAVCSCRRF